MMDDRGPAGGAREERLRAARRAIRAARAGELARAQAAEGEARKRLDALRREDGRWADLGRARLEGPIDVAKLLLVDACRSSLQRRIVDAAAEADRRSAETGERRAAFLEADRDLQALELLIERRAEASRRVRA